MERNTLSMYIQNLIKSKHMTMYRKLVYVGMPSSQIVRLLLASFSKTSDGPYVFLI